MRSMCLLIVVLFTWFETIIMMMMMRCLETNLLLAWIHKIGFYSTKCYSIIIYFQTPDVVSSVYLQHNETAKKKHTEEIVNMKLSRRYKKSTASAHKFLGY